VRCACDLLAVASLVLLVSGAGCAVGIPRVRGEPVAPSAPNHTCRPPPGVQVDDSFRITALPGQLEAPASSLTLPDIVNLALINNPATRESWAQARAYADAYGATRGVYFPTVDATLSATRSEQPKSGLTTLVGPRSTFAPSIALGYTVLDFGDALGLYSSMPLAHRAHRCSVHRNTEQDCRLGGRHASRTTGAFSPMLS